MATNVPKLHTPRLIARHKHLSTVFDESVMDEVWKKYVRPGLRNQEVLDLFDYNDFHWNRADRFPDLKKSILSGNYRAKPAIPTKIEKKYGICRTIVTPLPDDAIVLQCIVESMLNEALRKQPSKNSFFSRSHAAPDVEVTYHRDYIWFKQWRKFAKIRFQISSALKFVAVTDISTFFDNIDYSNLRNIISSRLNVDEVILDILFQVLENISWRPDYLPTRNVGLPQVQFDAPRLLAHIYLFEIDEYIKSRAGSNFVRWVDDITIACNEKSTAKAILRDLDTILHIRGLRLNAGKTKILSSSEAARHFWQSENDYFDNLEKQLSRGAPPAKIVGLARRKFNRLITLPKDGMLNKVLKRYVGFFAKRCDPHALDFCLSQFSKDTDLRDSIYRYFAALGCQARILRSIKSYLLQVNELDDASLSNLARVITEWPVKPGSNEFKYIVRLLNIVSPTSYVDNHPSRFLFSLWLHAKFSKQQKLFSFLQMHHVLWSSSEFLSRQVAACLAKIRNPAKFQAITKIISAHGFRSALSVVGGISDLKNSNFPLDGSHYMYILNGRNVSNYGLSRFLTIVAVFQSQNISAAQKNVLKNQIRKYLRDPHYLDVLAKL